MTQWQLLVCGIAAWLALRSLLQLAEAHRQRYREIFRSEQLAKRTAGNSAASGENATGSKSTATKPGAGGAPVTGGGNAAKSGGSNGRRAA